MRTISFSEARNHLKRVIDQVVDDADAVVMSLDTFTSWQETVYLIRNPANAAHLANSIKQLRDGEAKPNDLTDA